MQSHEGRHVSPESRADFAIGLRPLWSQFGLARRGLGLDKNHRVPELKLSHGRVADEELDSSRSLNVTFFPLFTFNLLTPLGADSEMSCLGGHGVGLSRYSVSFIALNKYSLSCWWSNFASMRFFESIRRSFFVVRLRMS